MCRGLHYRQPERTDARRTAFIDVWWTRQRRLLAGDSGKRGSNPLAGLPNLAIAGAAFRGVGVPDCVAQGRAATARVREALSGGVPDPVDVAEAR